MRALRQCRAAGYATAIEEAALGVNAVAVPVFDPQDPDTAVASIIVVGPSARMTPERMEAIVPLLLASASRISALWPIRRHATPLAPARAPDAPVKTGGGALLIWNDIAAGAEAAFREWHDEEHVPERVAIPGFLHGRRLFSRDATPRWLTFYEVDNVSVFSSPPYLARLDAPTPRTTAILPSFRMTQRMAGHVVRATGDGRGQGRRHHADLGAGSVPRRCRHRRLRAASGRHHRASRRGCGGGRGFGRGAEPGAPQPSGAFGRPTRPRRTSCWWSRPGRRRRFPT